MIYNTKKHLCKCFLFFKMFCFLGVFSSFFSTYEKEYLLFPLIHKVGRNMIKMYLKVISRQKKKKESQNLPYTY